MTDLWRRGAAELAGLIAGGRVTSEEVVEAHLARIAAVNPRLNAVVRVLATEARDAARAADAKRRAGEPLGPLHGVPFTVKENIDMAGLPTTWGMRTLAEAVVPLDAPVVTRMKAAGAIPLGRTNLPDMGLRVHTDGSLHGLTRNPWHADHTAGGSSGGEASALASGMSPIGLGNDIGGSLRNPAHCCGIASIKPSAGRVPDASLVPAPDRLLAVQLMNVQGPMARRVADLRLALGILSGPDPRDPLAFPVPLGLPAPPRPIGVAVLAEPPGTTVHPAVRDAVRRAADALADAGYAVRDGAPPEYEAALETWARLLGADFASVLPQLQMAMGEDAWRFLQASAERSTAPTDLPGFSMLLAQRDGIARAWSMFMAETPLVLTPVWTTPAFAHGFDLRDAAAVNALMRPVMPANLLGLPAACVPAGDDPQTGLPVGVQIMGARFRDDLCLDAAEAIERALPPVTPIDPRW